MFTTFRCSSAKKDSIPALPPKDPVRPIAAQAGVGKGAVFLYRPFKSRPRQAVVPLETAHLLGELSEALRLGSVALTLTAILSPAITETVMNPPSSPSSPADFTRELERRLQAVIEANEELHSRQGSAVVR